MQHCPFTDAAFDTKLNGTLIVNPKHEEVAKQLRPDQKLQQIGIKPSPLIGQLARDD